MDITTVGAKSPHPAKLFPCWDTNSRTMYHMLQFTKLACLPECGLEDLSRGTLFGVVVESVEKVSKNSLVSRDVRCFPTVYPLSAGLRQWQTRPPIRPPLVVLNTPRVKSVIKLINDSYGALPPFLPSFLRTVTLGYLITYCSFIVC